MFPVKRFDSWAFWEALHAEQVWRGLNNKEVAEQAGVTAVTLTRMSQGLYPGLDNVAALAMWADLCVNDFIID
jgi:hypothetical protein